MAQYKRRLIVCAKCGEERPYHGKGLCGTCYTEQWQEGHPGWIKPAIICTDCGEAKEHHAGGLCGVCYSRRYRVEHLEGCRKRDRSYARKHRKKRRAYLRRWYKENPAKRRAQKMRRYARKQSVPATLNGEQIELKLSVGHCFYCAGEIGLTLDHFVPLRHGGGTTQANTVVACKSCNSSKSDKLPSQVIEQLSLER